MENNLDETKTNWNRIYWLILVYNAFLVLCFFALSQYFHIR